MQGERGGKEAPYFQLIPQVVSGAGQTTRVCIWQVDAGTNLAPSEQPRGTGVWRQVAAVQLVSTVSAPVDSDVWAGGHKATQMQTLLMCTDTLRRTDTCTA